MTPAVQRGRFFILTGIAGLGSIKCEVKMSDIFVSYSFKDGEIAEFLCKHLTDEGLDVFRAPLSVSPGERWDEKILENLKNSPWVLFLASKAACASPIVQQEVGVALGKEKHLVPIVWDMDPSELPGWLKNVQALDLRNSSFGEARDQVSKIAERIKADKLKGYLIVGLVIAAILYVASKK